MNKFCSLLSRITNNRAGERRTTKWLPLLGALLFAAKIASAQGGIEQYQHRAMIGGRLPVTILLVGYSKDKADINKLFNIVSSKANEIYANLDWQNPSGDVGKLNTKAGTGPVTVSDDTLAAFEVAEKLSKWSGGAFDITYAGEGDWHDAKLAGDSVELKKSGMQVRFDQMINGFIAETISRLIYAAGMQNVMVKVGSVFRGIGQNTTGPWKIEIQDNEGTFAHHALNLTVANTGVAAVSAGDFRTAKLIDPRSKKEIAPPCRGSVVVMSDAAEADGISHAVFVMGPVAGMELLTKIGKGLIVDNNGKFARSPGF